MTTARDLIEDAFHDLDVSEAESSLEDFDAQFAFRQMKRMMASFRLSPEMGWTKPASLDAALTISEADEEFVQVALALRIAPSYDVPVPSGLRDTFKEARRAVFSRHLRLEPLKHDLPCPTGHWEYQSSNDADRNGNLYERDSKTVSSDYTIVLADDLIFVDASDGPVTLTLPSVSSANGYGFEIKKVDDTPNQIIFSPNGSDTVYGESEYRFNEHLRRIEIVSEGGTDWL